MTTDELQETLESKGYSLGLLSNMQGTDDGRIAMRDQYIVRSENDGTFYNLKADTRHNALVEALRMLGHGESQISLFQ